MADPLEPYWLALGKLVHRYAMIESALSGVLCVVAGVSRSKAKAIFSGTRALDAISFINRIHEVDKRALSPWLERAFPKIKELTTARNDILHQGFKLKGDRIIVSNTERTIPRAAVERPYSVADIYDMEADACVVIANLNMFWIEARYPKRYKWVPRERSIAQTPWRHKPPQPLRDQGRPAKTTKAQKASPQP